MAEFLSLMESIWLCIPNSKNSHAHPVGQSFCAMFGCNYTLISQYIIITTMTDLLIEMKQ